MKAMNHYSSDSDQIELYDEMIINPFSNLELLGDYYAL